jgi:hypothetical protein
MDQHSPIGFCFHRVSGAWRIVNDFKKSVDFGRAQVMIVDVTHAVTRRIHSYAENVVARVAKTPSVSVRAILSHASCSASPAIQQSPAVPLADA